LPRSTLWGPRNRVGEAANGKPQPNGSVRPGSGNRSGSSSGRKVTEAPSTQLRKTEVIRCCVQATQRSNSIDGVPVVNSRDVAEVFERDATYWRAPFARHRCRQLGHLDRPSPANPEPLCDRVNDELDNRSADSCNEHAPADQCEGLLPGHPFIPKARNRPLDVFCPGCGTSRAIDLRKVDRHPLASVATLVLGLRCSWCPESAPMPRILGLHALPPAAKAEASNL
jgi:hypothetical protein